MHYTFHKGLPRYEVLLGLTHICDTAVLPLQSVTTKREFVILVVLNISPDKLQLIFNFTFHLLQF